MDIAATARPEFQFLKALLCATLVTLSLLYLMHRLVYSDAVPVDVVVTPMPSIFWEEKTIITNVKEDKPIKPDDPHTPPLAPAPKLKPQKLPTEFTGEGFRFKPSKAIDDGGIGISTGGIIQQVMVPPVYPQRALSQGVEGYVDVRFKVTAMGSTEDVTILRGEPDGVFDRSAKRAVKRWKYLPDEKRLVPEVLQERIRFSITD